MRILLTGFVGLLALFFIYSCQKEISVEYGTPAQGSLQGSGGACLPKNVAGSYIAAKALNDSNFLEVTVDVLVPGPYTIATDTVNGFSFKTSGTFSSVGSTTIRLKGNGAPTNAGTSNFSVTFDSTSCDVAITVLPAGSTGGPATFILQGSPNACATSNLAGNYYKDSTLDARHSIKLDVNVTSVGTYTISTALVNGYSFSASSTFGAVGPAQVTLQATGKPAAAGTNNFTVTAGTQTCTFPVTVTVFTPPAGGACNPNVQGTFTAGTATTTTNKVTLTHTYAAAGTYNVTVPALNGVSFGTQAVVATIPGPNTITLTATGTPTTAGTSTFTVNFGDGQSCTFPVTVNSGTTPVVNNDYFPTTLNSWWSYDIGLTDTIKVTNTGNATVPGSTNTYQRFITSMTGTNIDTSYYRKNAANGFYYQSIDTGGFGFGDAGITFANPRFDVLFLKNTLATGDSLISDFNATFDAGTGVPFPIVIRFKFKVINSNATLTVNGKTFTNVYRLQDYIELGFMGTFDDLGVAPWDFYYARGVGLIRIDDGTPMQEIRSWVVN
ncbi:MAG TPA: hypothetical protein VGB71_10545 [Flavisolibacter sp.]